MGETMSTESTAVVANLPEPVAAARPRLNRATVILAFLSIYLIWGSTYLAIRYAVETIPPLYTAGLRHLTAGTILLFWCLAKRLRPTWSQVRASIIIGFFFFLIGHGTLHWAEQRVPSGPGVFIGSLAVVLGALSWSVGIVYSRRSHLSGHPLLLSALSLLAGSFQLLLVGTAAGEYRGFSFASVSLRSWLALGYLILFGSVVAFTAYNWLLENPIVAVLLGWLLAGEAVTVNVLLSMAMVIGAVMLVDRGMARLQQGS